MLVKNIRQILKSPLIVKNTYATMNVVMLMFSATGNVIFFF